MAPFEDTALLLFDLQDGVARSAGEEMRAVEQRRLLHRLLHFEQEAL